MSPSSRAECCEDPGQALIAEWDGAPGGVENGPVEVTGTGED